MKQEIAVAKQFDKAMVERLAEVFSDAEDAHEKFEHRTWKSLPKDFQESYRWGIRGILAELSKEYVIVPKSEYEALGQVIEAAEDVVRDVPPALDPEQPDEDDMDHALDLKNQIGYAGAALDALKTVLKAVEMATRGKDEEAE